MNCLKEAEEKLRDYNARKNGLQAATEEIARLQAKSTCIRSARTDGTPSRGGGNRREDALADNISTRCELERARGDNETWLRIVENALRTLDDEERMILDRFYINRHRGHAERLAEELCVEKAQVYRKKDKALRHFALALYGVVET